VSSDESWRRIIMPLSRPFSPRERVLRAQALLRRGKPGKENVKEIPAGGTLFRISPATG